MLIPAPPLEDYRTLQARNIDALNHALAGIPEDRVRYHLCWGSWQGPHLHDLGLRLRRELQICADRGDDPRSLRRDDAGVGLGAGKGALEVEHRAHERLRGQRLDERIARKAPTDEVHRFRALARYSSMNTVSPAPRSRTSQR
jgi:hypothetical protein